MTRSSWQAPLLWLAAFTGAVVFAVQVSHELAAPSVWDDAWMFVRYAEQLLATGVPAFAPGGQGVYGLTSPAFLSVVAPVRALLGPDAVRVALLSSLFCGVLFLAFLSRMVVRLTAGSPRRRAAAFALVGFTLAYAAPAIARHFASGMDTTFALAYFTVWIMLAHACSRYVADEAAWTLGAFGGMAFSVRPDLLVFTVGVPALGAVFATHTRVRRNQASAAVLALFVALLQSAVYAWWLHSPVPLPFFAKTFGFYGPTLRAAYDGVAIAEVSGFLRAMSALRAVFAAAVVLHPVRWWNAASALEKALLFTGIVFTAYHAFAVVPIMGYAGRFEMPLFPVLVYLAVCSLAHLAAWYPQAVWRSLLVTLVALAVAGVLVRRIVAHQIAPGPARVAAAERFDLQTAYRVNGRDYWVALDRVSRLPDDLTIATTEVGLPLVLSPGRRIVDLAGLNETSMMRHHVSADSVVRRDRPDLVYLPHPHYAEMRDALLADPVFVRDYEVWPAAALRADMGAAVRRDGPYADTLRALFEARAAVAAVAAPAGR